MTQESDRLDNLGAAARGTARVALRPRTTVFAAVTLAILLSWMMIGAMAIRGAEGRDAGSLAPGDSLLRALPSVALPETFERFFALCLRPVALSGPDPATALMLTLMWFLMAVAMMLPSAAPMIRTYCEIADTARAKREAVVHPLVLVAGYLATWLAASVAFAAATLALHWLAPAGGALDPVRGITGAVALAIAGLYQFSALKAACLKKCRNPFSILFARWSTRPAKIFRLGLEQGLWCVGCCWALMLVMFAVGVMNVFWMALLAVFAMVEKRGGSPLATRAAGTILLVWAASLLVISV